MSSRSRQARLSSPGWMMPLLLLAVGCAGSSEEVGNAIEQAADTGPDDGANLDDTGASDVAADGGTDDGGGAVQDVSGEDISQDDADEQDATPADGEADGAPLDAGPECPATGCACETAKVCDDGEPCTKDTCEEGKGCQHTPDEDDAACDLDDDACTVDQCDAGECKAGGGPDCDDGKLCTDDKCDPKIGCVHTPSTASCDDGDACTEGDQCAGGKCGSGKGVDCDDGLSCTADSCDKAKGCLHDADVAKCDDAEVCTSDSCDTKQGCVHLPAQGTCTDGDACTAGDQCAGGKCGSGAKVSCKDDGNVCTDEACDKAKGCISTPNQAACEDGSKCTSGDKCSSGKCVGGPAPKCTDDGNPCTNEVCDPKAGCVHKNNAAACEDGNKCTTGDKCSGGKCVGGPAPKCKDDGNPCTDEVCDPKAGCVHKNNTAKCDDGDACTTVDSCSGGVCKGSTPPNCDDGNVCQADACDKAKGCTHTPVKDGTPCGPAMTCSAGICETGDLDHDGLSGKADSCPTVWNPDADKVRGSSSCLLWSGTTWKKSRNIGLNQGGKASTWRRTNEPVEVPLVNGVVDSSLIGYWKLDGDAEDSSGAAHHGVINGAASTIGAFGSQGKALSFNGKSFVDTKTTVSIPKGGSLAAMMWIKTNATGTLHLFSTDQPGGDEMHVYINGQGGVHFHMRGAGEDFDVDSVGVDVRDGNWHAVAVVRHGAVGAVSIWIDGVLRLWKAVALGSNSLAGRTPFIGGFNRPGAQGGSFVGAIDEVLWFRRALTPAEIATYYHSKAPYGSTFVPGAQPDFDDVRVTETTPWQKEHGTHVEVIGARPHSDTDLKDIVAYWKLDGDAKDATGKHHGVLGAAKTTRGRFGAANGAVQTSAGPVQVPADGKLSGLSQLTVEAWARIDSFPPSGEGYELVSKFHNTDGAQRSYYLLLWDAGPGAVSLGGIIGNVGNKSGDINAKTPVTAGTWHHYAFTWDGKEQRLYFDGVELARKAAAFTMPATPSLPLRIGGCHGCKVPTFKGAIDEVIVHKVAKSADYIAKRARGLPRVRFLAHTAPTKNKAGRFDFYGYKLRWGNAVAKAAAMKVVGLDKKKTCDALLSPCLGYAGWWRFDEGNGLVSIDSASSRHHGVVPKGTSYVAGRDGTALSFAGAGPIVFAKDIFDVGKDFSVEGVLKVHGSDGVLEKRGAWDGLRWWTDGKAMDMLMFGDGKGKVANVGYAMTFSGWNVVAHWVDYGKKKVAATLNHGKAHEKSLPFTTVGNAGALMIGKSNGNNSEAVFDMLRIMHRVLGQDEHLHTPPATAKLGLLQVAWPVVIDDFNRPNSAAGLGKSPMGWPWYELGGDASSRWKLSGGAARAVWTGAKAPNPVAAVKAWHMATFQVRVKFMLASFSGVGGPVLYVGVNSSAAGKDPAKDTGLQVHLGAGKKGIWLRRNKKVLLYKAGTSVLAGKWYHLLLDFDGKTFAATLWEVGKGKPASPAASVATTNVGSQYDAIMLSGDRSTGESVDLRIDEIVALK